MKPIISHNTLQVAILETGKLELIVVVGVVNEGYNTGFQPGLSYGTVGYYTNGDIYVAENRPLSFDILGTKGMKKWRNRTFCKSNYSKTPLIQMPKGYKNLVNGVVVLKEFLKQEND